MIWYDGMVLGVNCAYSRALEAVVLADEGRAKEEASAFLDGVERVATLLYDTKPGREGPIVYVRWFADKLQADRYRHGLRLELAGHWCAGRNAALKAIQTRKLAYLKTLPQPEPGSKGYDHGGWQQPPGFRKAV